MAIDDNINAVKAALIAERTALNDDKNAPTPVSNDIQARAINAIHGGIVEYVHYMRLFAGPNGEDLARLLPLEDPLDPERQKARAYLLRNGVCAHGTGDFLDENVVGRL